VSALRTLAGHCWEVHSPSLLILAHDCTVWMQFDGAGWGVWSWDGERLREMRCSSREDCAEFVAAALRGEYDHAG
jgi:hypothetical protein